MFVFQTNVRLFPLKKHTLMHSKKELQLLILFVFLKGHLLHYLLFWKKRQSVKHNSCIVWMNLYTYRSILDRATIWETVFLKLSIFVCVLVSWSNFRFSFFADGAPFLSVEDKPPLPEIVPLPLALLCVWSIFIWFVLF